MQPFICVYIYMNGTTYTLPMMAIPRDEAVKGWKAHGGDDSIIAGRVNGLTGFTLTGNPSDVAKLVAGDGYSFVRPLGSFSMGEMIGSLMVVGVEGLAKSLVRVKLLMMRTEKRFEGGYVMLRENGPDGRIIDTDPIVLKK